MMLGKLPPKVDPRTLMLASVLRASPAPAYWAYDDAFPLLAPAPTPMWRNDELGDCVIVSQGHLTLRLEGAEHGVLPAISDGEVVAEYFRQSGGRDVGLYMLDAANEWRQHGLIAGGKAERIAAYGQIATNDVRTVKRTCAADLGLWIGVSLPETAADQFERGHVWRVTKTSGRGTPGSWGGHAMAVVAYSPSRLWVGTWGNRQAMTWPFFRTYCDECYGVVDRLDNPAVNSDALVAYLQDKAVV